MIHEDGHKVKHLIVNKHLVENVPCRF